MPRRAAAERPSRQQHPSSSRQPLHVLELVETGAEDVVRHPAEHGHERAEDDDARVEASSLHELGGSVSLLGMPRRAAEPRPTATPFFFAAAFCLSSNWLRPGPGCCTPPSRARHGRAEMMMRARGQQSAWPVAASACSGMPRGGSRELGPAATPFFFAAAFCMSSSWLRPGPRMLYATQPSTGTAAPKMMMRVEASSLMSSVAASLLGHARRRRRKPEAEGDALLALSVLHLHVIELVQSGSQNVERDPCKCGPRITRNTRPGCRRDLEDSMVEALAR